MDRLELLKKLDKNEVILSHSSFNEFCKSPQHFISHKLRERKQTDAMKFGAMVHCMILEPDEFNNRFDIAPECDRRTKVGKALWQDFLDGKREGTEVVKHTDFMDADRIAKAILHNPASAWVFENVGQTEVSIEWEYKGLKWRGFIDGIGNDIGIIVDLKILADVSPKKVERYIRYEGAGRQAVHYKRGSGKQTYDYYVVGADRSGAVSVTKLGRGVLNAASRDLDWYITQFKRCRFENAWNQSYDFFAPNGIYEMTSW